MPTATKTKSTTDVKALFDSQVNHQRIVARSSAKERIQKLKKLHQAVLNNKEKIRKALHEDYRKHPSEVDLTEIYPVTGDIKHTISHLRRWMRPQHVNTPLSLMGSSSWVHYEPKGVCLIISPWNFPLNLTFGPMISAIAAGNCIMLKPSEHTPHISQVMADMIAELFDPQEITVVQGGIESSKALLELPFNHIFFTGAPSIGKIVMAAAAKNLTSVTLELGGKSPTIVDETANIKTAAKRIAWSKCLNNGQVCIAPDYIYVHESKKDELIDAINSNIKKMYGDSIGQSESYCRIVNNKHFNRVKSYMDEAMNHDVKIEGGGKMDGDQDFIEPTIISNVNAEMDLMLHEIFGPLLPIMTYSNLDEALDKINKKEKPLSLYIYSNKKKNVNKIINETSAGGTCINHSAIHFFNNNLPFGGVNNSGIGKAHGKYGFEAFSNARAVLKQWSPMSAIELMAPPYTDLKQKLIDLSIKYF
jgi:aldehyde dehydrogenase (NAD+)